MAQITLTATKQGQKPISKPCVNLCQAEELQARLIDLGWTTRVNVK